MHEVEQSALSPSVEVGKARIRTSPSKINVQFRLDPQPYQALEQRARAAESSAGMIARDIVMRHLTMPTEDQMAALLASQAQVLAELRKDIRLGVEALLIAAGKMEPDEAKEWVAANLPAT